MIVAVVLSALSSMGQLARKMVDRRNWVVEIRSKEHKEDSHRVRAEGKECKVGEKMKQVLQWEWQQVWE